MSTRRVPWAGIGAGIVLMLALGSHASGGDAVPGGIDVRALMGASPPQGRTEPPPGGKSAGGDRPADPLARLGKPATWDGKALPVYPSAASAAAAADDARIAADDALGRLRKHDVRIAALRSDADKRAAELAEIVSGKEPFMDEIRNGLFCSGCGLTRSVILSRREKFPHPGQRVIPPTQEQIDAKEREYDARITRAQEAEGAARKQLREAEAQRGKTVRALGYEIMRMLDALRQEGPLLLDAFHARKVNLERQLSGLKANLREAERLAATGRDARDDGKRPGTNADRIARLERDRASLASRIGSASAALGRESDDYDRMRARFFDQVGAANKVYAEATRQAGNASIPAWFLTPESTGIPRAAHVPGFEQDGPAAGGRGAKNYHLVIPGGLS